MQDNKKTSISDEQIDFKLRQQLKHIRDEDTPERLLDLARTLQELLRQRDTSD